MSNRFRKLADVTWGLACEEQYARGDDVLVERKDGSSDVLKAGEYLGTNQYGDHLHRIWNEGGDNVPKGNRVKPVPHSAVASPPPAKKLLPDDEIPF